MRKLIWGFVALLGFGAVAAGLAYWQIDRIAREATERGTSYALGVKSEVRSARVSLLEGRIRLAGLKLHNPEGYETPFLLANDTLTVHAEPSSLFSEVIRVRSIELDGVTLHVEKRRGRSNLKAVLDHLRRLGRGNGPIVSPDTRRKLRVDRVVLRNVVAHVQTLPVGGDLSTVTVHVPKLEFEDVASGPGPAVAVAELTRRLTPAIVLGVFSKGGELPHELITEVGGDVVRIVQQLGGDGRRLLEQVSGPLVEGVVEALEKAVGSGENLGELLGRTLDQTIGQALENLFKPKQPQPGPDQPQPGPGQP